MQRWIVSFVVVVAAVAVFLYLSDPSKPEPDSTPERRPPQRPLEDGEVRRYIAVMTEFPAQLRAVGDAFEVARRAALEKGETLDEAAMSASSSAKWDAFFSRHQISRDGFNELRTRVEYVVDSLRDEATWETTLRNDLIAKAEEKEEVAARAPKDSALRKQLLEDVAALQERIDGYRPPPVHDVDRKLVRSYWKDLDKLAPRLGMPKELEPGGGR